MFVFFFFKQKTAYEIYQCDWSSDVCSSDLNGPENVAPYIWIGQISLSIAGRLKLISSRTGLTSIIAALLLIMNPGLKEQDLKDPSVSKHLTYPPLGIVLKAIRHNKKIADVFFSKATYTQSLIGDRKSVV